jgi:hypothetical protein
MTRWPRYSNGLKIVDIALLAYAADPITEPALVVLSKSFDRLIRRAHYPICEGKVSVFDQAQINSFIADCSGKHERMLMVKVQKSTFRAYKDVWKCLLCFVDRTSQPSQSNQSLHRFTDTQLFRLDQVMRLAEEIGRDLNKACLHTTNSESI